MSQRIANRVYLDSGVLIHWLFGNTATTLGAATTFLNEVSTGKYEGILSALAVKELIKYVRNIAVKNGETNPQKWLDREEKLIGTVWSIKGIKIIEGNSEEWKMDGTDVGFADVSMDALALMRKYGGSAKRNPSNSKMEHDGLHPMDALHLAVAKRVGCSKIATFDNDFNETKTELEPMRLGSVA